MDAMATLNTFRFLSSVSQFGGQLSQLLHNFLSLESRPNDNLSGVLQKLDATICIVDQLSGLIGPEESPKNLLSADGLQYVEKLAEECSVAMDTVRLIASGGDEYALSPKYWDSRVSVDEKGHRLLEIPELEERIIFKGLQNAKRRGYRNFFKYADPAGRLEEIQTLLLLVVQIVTVRGMTDKLQSGDVDLKSIVEYHARISRAARKAHLVKEDGIALRSRSRRRSRSRSRYRSSSSSSGSDSDIRITYRRRSPSPKRRPLGRPRPPAPAPPPPPGDWMKFPPPRLPPPGLQSVVTGTPNQTQIPYSGQAKDVASPFPASPSAGSTGIAELKSETTGVADDHHPPSYTENDQPNTPPSAKMIDPDSVPRKEPHGPLDFEKQSTEEKAGEVCTDSALGIKTAKIPVSNNDRLLKSSSTFGIKFKSFFRSKSSLEAEMRRELASANAHLNAFVLQRGEFRKVPHSAFHTLEHTHVRTILSQLKDSTWFKIFSDLTDAEHATLAGLLSDRVEGGKCYKRELVVLNILKHDRSQAWARVTERCFDCGSEMLEDGDSRGILAIIREKERDPDDDVELRVPPAKPSITQNSTLNNTPLPRPHVKDPLPCMPREGRMIVDLNYPIRNYSDLNHYPPAEPRFGPACGPPPFSGPRPYQPVVHSGDVSIGIPITEEKAREALSSYSSFTLRPTPPVQSQKFYVEDERPDWVRCFLTREYETTQDLLEKIGKFKKLGVSIIDTKLLLTGPQSAHMTRLIEELNRVEVDSRFEYTMVEISTGGRTTKSQSRRSAEVIHMIAQRTLKDGWSPTRTYEQLIQTPRAPLPTSPPPPPPPRPMSDIIVVESADRRKSSWRRVKRRRGGRSRSVASSYFTSSSSDSDSSTSTFESVRSGRSRSRRRRTKRGYCSDLLSDSESSSDEEHGARWRVDPIEIKFSKKEVGMDIVQLLLDRWVPAVEGKAKGSTAEMESTGRKAENKTPPMRAQNEGKKAKVEDALDD